MQKQVVIGGIAWPPAVALAWDEFAISRLSRASGVQNAREPRKATHGPPVAILY